MSALSDRVADALSAVVAATSHYAFNTSGLVPNPDKVAHAERWLKDNAPPTPMDDEEYLERIRAGEGRFTAARNLGIDPVRIARRLEVDEGFALAVRVAKAEALEPVLQTVREAGIAGNLRAALKLLESQDAEEFGQKERGGPQVNVNILNAGTGDPVVDGIQELRDELRKQQSLKTGAVLALPAADA